MRVPGARSIHLVFSMSSGSPSSHFRAPSPEDLQPLFPAYHLEGFLTQGSVGAIYRAHQTALDRPVAIKILPPEFAAMPGFRESFEAEAKAMARLNHPNLIAVYDFGEVERMLFLVMELVEGNSLDEWSAGIAMGAPQALELLEGVCDGIAHAHEHGLLHRHIAPATILIDKKRHPKIGNFGLAQEVGEIQQESSSANPDSIYTAPEVHNRETSDSRADVYSLGVLLHRLLTGETPESLPLAAIASQCGTPLVLDTLIARATSQDPQRRFETVEEFRNNLEQGLRSASRTPTVRPRPTAAPAPVSPPPSVLPSRPAPPAPVQKGSGIGTAVGATMILAAAGAGVYFGLLRKPAGEDPVSSTPSIIEVPVALQPTGEEEGEPSDRIPEDDRIVDPVPGELARLKAKLAAGERDEFPQGTVNHNDSHFLVLNVEMNWNEARRFAEAHGAHLAILSSAEEQDWFRQTFPFSSPVWLGACQGANDQWLWVDGTPWAGQAPVVSGIAESHAMAFSNTGALFPSDPGTTHTLALQWRADGSNPANLESQLRQVAESLSGTDRLPTSYPIGTRTRGESHYLLVDKELTWDDARLLAESVGAYLAVPSSPEEHAWMLETFGSLLGEDRSAWLGGFLLKPGDRWQWLTREGWLNVGWQPGQPGLDEKANRLAMRGSAGEQPAGWVAGDGETGLAQSLLLEWSTPPAPVTVARFDRDPWLEGVHQKMRPRVESDLNKFKQLKGDLVKDYGRVMGRLIRKEDDQPSWRDRGRGQGFDPRNFRWPGGNRPSLEELEESLKEAVKNGELLGEFPFGIPEAVQEQQTRSEAELKLLEEAYDLKVTAHLDFYREGVQKKASDLAETGYLDDARQLEELATSLTNNLPAFLKLLFKDSPLATLPWPPNENTPAQEPEAPDDFGPLEFIEGES